MKIASNLIRMTLAVMLVSAGGTATPKAFATLSTGETARCCQTGHCGANVPLCTSNQKSKDYGGGSEVNAAPQQKKGGASVSAEGGSKK
jgi:hypothetical protein